MITVPGRTIYTTLEEIIDPRHTALLVLDVQNDFCAEGGLMHRLGKDLSMMKGMVDNVRRTLEAARAAGVLPIYIQNSWLPEHRAASGAWLRFTVVRYGMDPRQGCTVDGTGGPRSCPKWLRAPATWWSRRWRSSSIVGTNLDMVLRCNGIQTVVLTGDVTQGCVESTARDAAFCDYYVVVLEDCVATYDRELHEASLKVLRTRVDVARAEEVLALWARARAGRGRGPGSP